MKRLISMLLCCLMMYAVLPAMAQEAPLPAATETPAPAPTAPAWTVLEQPQSPDFVPLLMAVAEAELGYVEGGDNLTKYGEWAGDPHAAWCAEFICWCVDQVDQQHQLNLLTRIYPRYSGQNTGRDWYIARGRFLYRKGVCPDWGPQWLAGADRNMMKNEYMPRMGDLMFFSYNEAGDTEHVALVEFTARHENGQLYVHVIEGNNPDRVQRKYYALDDSQVLGYGLCEDIIGTTMRFGNTGDKVLTLQKSLWELGYLEEKHITGTYGSNTRAAVHTFQAKAMHQENPTGVANLYTQRAIQETLDEQRFNSPESWLVTE